MNTTIRLLTAEDYPAFFIYLNEQLADNGKNGMPLFQPVSRDLVTFPPEKESAFVAGLSKNVGQPGWRRAWVICDDQGGIMGHVDLRAHVESGITHRALLGMGVGKQFRRQGLGRQLLDYACQWVRENEMLEWIDIEVLAGNEPAVSLYRNSNFEELCLIPDQFRIDGRSEAVIRLAKKFT